MRPKSYLALALAAALMLALGACSSGGDDAPPPGDTMTDDQAAAEAKALADAQKAAMDAWRAARDALAGIAGKESADPAAYQRAMNALADAKAASDAAAAATTSADAKKYQAAAEAANMIAMAQVAMVVAAYEAPALDAAQMAAKSAADMAMTAYNAAKTALAGVESIKGDDMASYDMAKAKVDAAKAAYDAAKAASDAAAATSNLADAKMYQATAEAELAKANTANTEAMKYAGMVQTAHDTRVADEAETERQALADAKSDSQDAYDTAKMAYDAAKTRFDALADKKDDNLADHVRAGDALARAKTALDAAMAANDKAQAATTSADAEMYKQQAETAAGNVATQVAGANMYAGLVEAAYMSAEAERKRVADEAKALADAKADAMKAATAARTAANEARTQATKVAELLGPNSAQAMAADEAATAAETAATAAEEASARAQDDTASEDAIAEQRTAEGKQSEAEMKLADATELAREAGVATAGLDQLRIELARNDAEEAKNDAAKYASEARQKATDARQQADDASDEANRAMRARTNYAEAKKKAAAADTAATMAENAATAAETASGLANDEYVKTTAADVTADAARAARDEARDQRDAAMTSNTTAGEQYMAAMEAAGDAMKYANTHVVGLLMMANAAHIVTAADPDANLDETELELIRKNRNAHIANVNTAVHVTTGGPLSVRDPVLTAVDNQGGGTVTAVSYPYWTSLGADGTIGGTDTNADTGPGEGKPALTVTPTGGTALVLTHAGPGADGNAGTDDDVTANFSQGPGLGDFVHEKYISSGDATPRTRVILFTDLEQGSMGRAPQTVSYFGEPVVASRIATVNTATPVADTERDYNATYDHDGDAATAPIAVVLNCGTTCNLRVINGEIVSISGYTFQTAGDVAVAGVEPAEDTTWLAFGIWLTETVVENGVNTYTFGAFADGGAAVGDTDEPSTVASVTGDATYRGKAAGVHSTATAVDFFHADAMLNAKFGDGTATGTITGKIHNIMSGGRSVDHDIELLVVDPGANPTAANIVDAGTVSGQTRMGPITGTDSAGEAVYQMTGDWSGTFYNHMADDTETANVDESTLAPGSIAGTFGVGRADVATTMDVDETESYVGAFGAHCSGANCNPH